MLCSILEVKILNNQYDPHTHRYIYIYIYISRNVNDGFGFGILAKPCTFIIISIIIVINDSI
jgi:hypothetical protein